MNVIKNFQYHDYDVSYNVWGENERFTVDAHIHPHDDQTDDHQIYMTEEFEDSDSAEEAIIRNAKQWIDQHRN